MVLTNNIEENRTIIIIQIITLIGLTFIAIALILFDFYLFFHTLSLNLIIILFFIGFGILFIVLFQQIRKRSNFSQKFKNQKVGLLHEDGPNFNDDLKPSNNLNEDDMLFDVEQEINYELINEIMLNWGLAILKYYKEFFKGAQIIYLNFNPRINVDLFRIDLYWEFVLNSLKIEYRKISSQNINTSGVYVHSLDNFIPEIKNSQLHSLCKITISNFSLTLKNIYKLLKYYTAEKQAKDLIENDLMEYSKYKKVSHNIILKKFWLDYMDIRRASV
ncbi:MAG: hypothetical protein ACFFEY_02210 [Candidatus Thorarchaeota archaeon]